MDRMKLEAEQYVTTTKKKMVKIEMVGFDKTYEERADVSNSRDITLDLMGISDVGPPGELRKLIPGTMNLYLDKNKILEFRHDKVPKRQMAISKGFDALTSMIQSMAIFED